MKSTVQRAILREIKANGSATHHDIAEALGIVPKTASAHLCQLGKHGALTLAGKTRFAVTGRPCNLWKLPQAATVTKELKGQ